MAEPKINLDNLLKWPKALIVGIPVVLFLLAAMLSFFKGYTALGREGKKNIYDPNECGAGFVTKADSVLALLLCEVDTTAFAVSIDSLNARYRALEFALPYGEEDKSYIEASDIRLVGIHPEYIKDKNLVNFYYNSRLPQLLEQQARHPGETYFSIRSRGMKTKEYGVIELDGRRHGRRADGRRPIVIESIKMIPPMFKVALEKNPWTGVIESTESCLFPDSSTIYLTYGNTVLPIHRDSRFANVGGVDNVIRFQAIMNEGKIMWTPNTGRQSTPSPIDYYAYYKRAFISNSGVNAVRLGLHRNQQVQEVVSMTLSLAHDTLQISHEDCGVSVVRQDDRNDKLNQVMAADLPTRVPYEDGMKILVYAVDGNKFSSKLGEFTLYSENPSKQLSRLTQSSQGTSRYFISDYQTDLFTQQLLRGLSRHLSNRENIDTVQLSIDPLLSREFENEIISYVKALPQKTRSDVSGNRKPASQKLEEYDMSVTIMDMATGEVLATPFYTTLFDKKDYPEELKRTTRNTSLVRRSIGSTFKPMVALASVLAVPSLLDLDTKTHGYSNPNWEENTVTFFGRATTPWAKKSPAHWNGRNFTDFLGYSDDVYPVALAAFALSGKNSRNGTSLLPVAPSAEDSFFEMKGGRLAFRHEDVASILSDKSAQPFISNMSTLYALPLNDLDNDASLDRMTDINLFRNLTDMIPETRKSDKVFGLQEVSPDQTQLRMHRFYNGDDFRTLLVPWVLGQGDNMWNCVKIAEAWARMIGKQEVQASFIHDSNNSHPCSIIPNNQSIKSFDKASNRNETWNSFLSKFSDAQNRGTLKKMNDTLHVVAPRLKLFSKTGTPDAYIRYEFPMLCANNRFMDVGMYTFALVDSCVYNQKIRNNQPGKGLVCVVRITRSYECEKCRKKGKACNNCEPYWGIDSSIARDFFASNRNRLRKLIDMTRTYIYEGKAPTTTQTMAGHVHQR